MQALKYSINRWKNYIKNTMNNQTLKKNEFTLDTILVMIYWVCVFARNSLKITLMSPLEGDE